MNLTCICLEIEYNIKDSKYVLS